MELIRASISITFDAVQIEVYTCIMCVYICTLLHILAERCLIQLSLCVSCVCEWSMYIYICNMCNAIIQIILHVY